jgi:signal transduction protein with GAF and PtsI domain
MTDDIASLRAAHDRLKLLYQVGNVLHSTLDPQKALELIIQEAVRVMRATSGSLHLINPTNSLLEIHASAGLPAGAREVKLRIGQGVTGWVARTGKPARVGDVREDHRYVMLHQEVLSELAVPLEVMGEVRGVLNVDSKKMNAFSQADQELLEELAVQAAKVIHNTWLFEQSRLKARLLETLASVSRSINSALHVDEALQLITREACTLMEARMCSF